MIRITGCSVFKYKKNFFSNFLAGSRVYIKKKSKFGVLESVVIKKVHLVTPEKSTYEGVYSVVSYVDTFNRIWMEDEIISKEEALNYAKNYWTQVERDQEFLEKQGICF